MSKLVLDTLELEMTDSQLKKINTLIKDKPTNSFILCFDWASERHPVIPGIVKVSVVSPKLGEKLKNIVLKETKKYDLERFKMPRVSYTT